MKKFISLVLVLGIGVFSGNLFGQVTHDDKKEDSKKGGFSVGGFDESRKSVETRSIPAATKQSEEAPAPAAAPAMEMKEAQESVEPSVPKEQKTELDNADATTKLKEAVKNKEKQKKAPKTKGKR
jgi:hypothetical protein